MEITKYSKAIVPLLVLAALAGLKLLQVTPDMSVKDALTLIATSLLVYAVPNKES